MLLPTPVRMLLHAGGAHQQGPMMLRWMAGALECCDEVFPPQHRIPANLAAHTRRPCHQNLPPTRSTMSLSTACSKSTGLPRPCRGMTS